MPKFNAIDRVEYVGSPQAARTDGFIFKAGDSTTRIVTTAAGKFQSWYTESTASSGSIEGLYYRTYASTAGTSTVQALRAFTTVNGVGISNARGANISLNFGSTGGKVTGEGSAMKATIHIPEDGFAADAGTLAGVVSEIWSDHAASDPANASVSYFRAVNGGDTTGGADVDDDVALIRIEGHTIGTGNLIEAVLTEYALSEFTHSLRIKIENVAYYIPIGTTAGNDT